MDRNDLARLIGDLVLQTLELQAQVAALKKQIAENERPGGPVPPVEPVTEAQG